MFNILCMMYVYLSAYLLFISCIMLVKGLEAASSYAHAKIYLKNKHEESR